MSDAVDQLLADDAISHQIRLLHFTAGEQKKIYNIIGRMQAELVSKLNSGLSDYGKKRVYALLEKCSSMIGENYKQMLPLTTDDYLLRTAQRYESAEEFIDSLAKYYHGTVQGGFKEFTNEFLGTRTGAASAQKGIFFTTNKRVADTYAEIIADKSADAWDFLGPEFKIEAKKEISRVYETYLHMKKTYVYDFKGKAYRDVTFSDIMDKAKKEGYDSVLFKNVNDAYGSAVNPIKADIYAVFDASQIKTKEQMAEIWKNAPKGTDHYSLAKLESETAIESMARIGLEAALPTEAMLQALVNGSLIEGAPSSAWWAKQSEDLQFKFAAQVRQGIAQGETVMQIVRRVAGSKRLGTAGIMDVSRRNAFALVHTSVQQVANDARLAVFQANADILKGVRQVSTLDGRTSPICIAYSGGQWDLEGKPINGTKLPFAGGTPRHFNCRSVLVPITKSYRELGLDIDEVPPSTRASDLGQIPADTTFAEFLKRHDAAYADNLLGPGRAKLWREGKITLNQLLDGSGRELTLKKLRGK